MLLEYYTVIAQCAIRKGLENLGYTFRASLSSRVIVETGIRSVVNFDVGQIIGKNVLGYREDSPLEQFRLEM